MKVKGRPERTRIYRELGLEDSVVCDNCTLRCTIYGGFAFCPDCGRCNSRRILDKNVSLAEKMIDLTGQIEGVLSSHQHLGELPACSIQWPSTKNAGHEARAFSGCGSIDATRMSTLAMSLGKAKGRIPEAIRQAYCVVVTVSEKNDVQAFKLTVTDDPHFSIIKGDKRARIQDTAIEAEALLPDGPYDLWREGDTARRVKDLAGAFAQLPHLPKMLKADAILDTLVGGCEQGAFVLRLTRPDGSYRTWWRGRPDDTALSDPALELVLPEAAELAEIAPQLLGPQKLPDLWAGDELTAQDVINYFDGSKVVQIDRDGYSELRQIPKAAQDVVEAAIAAAVKDGAVWLLSGPASILGEDIPPGVLTPASTLCVPPASIPPAEILPANLENAWQQDETTALAIATNLSNRFGKTLPWKTVKDVITGALQARFVELVDGSATWPCEFHAAQSIQIRVATGGGTGGGSGGGPTGGFAGGPPTKKRATESELEPSELQDLSDILPRLIEIRAKSDIPLTFRVRVELGDGTEPPSQETIDAVNKVLGDVKVGFRIL